MRAPRSTFALALALCLAAPLAHADDGPLAAARARLQAKDYAGARELAKQRIEAAPEDAEAYFVLGRAALAQEAYDDAAAAFERAVTLKPTFDAARFNWALALRKGGRLQRAADAYRLYLAEHPEDADAQYGLGETLEGLGDKAGAASAFDRYADAEKDPSRTAWVERARARAAQLRASVPAPAPALAAAPAAAPALAPPAPTPLAAAPQVAPPEAAAPMSLPAAPVEAASAQPSGAPERPAEYDAGRKFLEAKKLPEARAALIAAEKKAPTDAFVRALAAASAMLMEDFEAAIVSFRAALAHASPEATPAIRFGLAEALQAHEQPSEARAEYTALRDDPRTPAALRDKALAKLR